MNRDGAFFMDIRDPENLDKNDAIQEMFVISGGLIIFSGKGIYKVKTADNIDPQKLNEQTRHAYEKIYGIGCDSKYVSRTIIQFKNILSSLQSCREKTDSALGEVWKAARSLIRCAEIFINLGMKLLIKCR